ncbi:hypothetical protein YZ82_01555 [Campylobacter hyointestinalis]|uniref:Uncharacterized protein n=1 Tax=Campylobacter hyointestinalis TaxID=198 RepID=A0A562XKF2_CAMHY|nr:hypothetical protein [Campylobacter hyointestinalis]TWO22629.1 hypothetical protein YZ82_01555 [Campylobacter hyointestinalis]
MSNFKELLNAKVQNGQKVTNTKDTLITNITFSNELGSSECDIKIGDTSVLNVSLSGKEIVEATGKILLPKEKELSIELKSSDCNTKISELNKLSPLPVSAKEISYVYQNKYIIRKWNDSGSNKYELFDSEKNTIINIGVNALFAVELQNGYVLVALSKENEWYKNVYVFDSIGTTKVSSKSYGLILDKNVILSSSIGYIEANSIYFPSSYSIFDSATGKDTSYSKYSTFTNNSVKMKLHSLTNASSSSAFDFHCYNGYSSYKNQYGTIDDNGIYFGGEHQLDLKTMTEVTQDQVLENIPANQAIWLRSGLTITATDKHGNNITINNKAVTIEGKTGKTFSKTTYLVKSSANEFIFLTFPSYGEKVSIWKVNETGMVEFLPETIINGATANTNYSIGGSDPLYQSSYNSYGYNNGIFYANADDMEFVFKVYQNYLYLLKIVDNTPYFTAISSTNSTNLTELAFVLKKDNSLYILTDESGAKVYKYYNNLLSSSKVASGDTLSHSSSCSFCFIDGEFLHLVNYNSTTGTSYNAYHKIALSNLVFESERGEAAVAKGLKAIEKKIYGNTDTELSKAFPTFPQSMNIKIDGIEL